MGNGDRQLDFEEFVNLLVTFRKTDGFTDREVAEFQEVFDKFKVTRDHSDEVVNCLELMDVLRSMGYVTNLDMVRKFIKQVDFDNSNTLDFWEFIRLLRMNREVELKEAFDAFQSQSEDSVVLKQQRVPKVLKGLGYSPTDDMLHNALSDAGLEVTLKKKEKEEDKKEEDEKEEEEERKEKEEGDMSSPVSPRSLSSSPMPPDPAQCLDFNVFVHVLDQVRKALMEIRRKNAGYSDEDVDKYAKAFAVYDEDGNGDIEKHELTNLLNDLGIPMRSQNEQQAMLQKLDVARIATKEAGVDDELIGVMGDPSVTFSVLLFLVRMLATAADHAEVDRDREIQEKTGFSPKEAEEFREIFTFWAVKAGALDAGQEAPQEETRASLMGSGPNGKDDGSQRLLTQDGMRRVVRSLGLTMTPEDKSLLDDRLLAGPHDKDSAGKYGFFEFLLFMRWMMDTDFASMNETVALTAEGKEGDAS